jgi:hypothetical protein
MGASDPNRDEQLSEWLEQQIKETTRTGDVEGIVLAGITDNMADIFARYVEKSLDYQTQFTNEYSFQSNT